jgi:NAD(P)-dependent dehydrogenase (short-subunit alcohol dehydrogenase family)
MKQQDLQGKIALVTGGTSGIGKVTAIELARRGAHVVVVGRDRERGAQALAEITAASGSTAVEGLFGDLSSQQGVRELAARFLATHDRLHILVNNAGIVTRSRTLTVDGQESTFAVNFLTPFLLTRLS